jgi:hypothetical protein
MKFTKATEETNEMVTKISQDLGLEGYGVEFEAIYVKKAKEVCKVVKANDYTKYKAEKEDLVFVVCYEDFFEGIDAMGHAYASEEDKFKALRLAMEQVSFDPEKEKLIIGCNSVLLPVGYCISNEDAVKSALYNATIMAKIQQDKKEEEDKRKALRTKGRKNGGDK